MELSAELLVSGVIFLAALTQSITGFGFAIVSMSFLPKIVGLQTAVPLVTLVSVIANIVIWFSYRRDYIAIPTSVGTFITYYLLLITQSSSPVGMESIKLRVYSVKE